MSELSCGTRFIGRNEMLDLSLYLELQPHECEGGQHETPASRARATTRRIAFIWRAVRNFILYTHHGVHLKVSFSSVKMFYLEGTTR